MVAKSRRFSILNGLISKVASKMACMRVISECAGRVVILRVAIFTVVFSSTLTACGNFSTEWREEVLLDNGTIMLVERTAGGSKLGEIGGPGGWESEEMSVQIISDNIPNPPPIWRTRYVPMLMDYDEKQKEWFIVATFYTCQGWESLGKPKLPYVEYRARNGIWITVPLSPELIGRKANLEPSISSGGMPELVKLDDKTPDSRTGKKFLSVLAEWHTNC